MKEKKDFLHISVYAHQEDKKEIEKFASEANRSISEYLRLKGLKKRV